MKLATLAAGGRDGTLLVVSHDLTRAVAPRDVSPTLQHALDDWARIAPQLGEIARNLEVGACDGAFPCDGLRLAAPLPRAYQWVDGSAYLHHVELVRKARGAALPPELLHDPLLYQGGSDTLLGPRDPLEIEDPEWGLDFEAEVVVVVDDVELAATPAQAGERIRLVGLVNDVSLRQLVPRELAKGFGFFQSKPSSAFAPVFVTPTELGGAWDGARLHGALRSYVNGAPFGCPDAGEDMHFDFPTLIAHAARTRRLGAGTILGSGTVSNRDRSRGSSCIVERRMYEVLEHGSAVTPFLAPGDTVRIEMLDDEGCSIFGAIEQRVVSRPRRDGEDS